MIDKRTKQMIYPSHMAAGNLGVGAGVGGMAVTLNVDCCPKLRHTSHASHSA